MRPSPAVPLVAIAGVVLAAGLAILLWPSTASPGVRPPPVEEDRAVALEQPVVPALPEPASSRTISPRPFDASIEAPPNAAPAIPAAAEPGAAFRGRVLDGDRGPASGAQVLLYAMQAGAPSPRATSLTRTDHDGAFALPIPRPVPPDWAIVAFMPLRRPATLRSGGEPREAIELVLGDGAAIDGMFSVDGAPAESARVTLSRPELVSGIVIPDEIMWSGDAFETRRAVMITDANGRFRSTGLAAQEYQVEALQMAKAGTHGVTCRANVRAPATGVRLEVATGWIRLKVMGDGQVLTRARVAIAAATGRPNRGDASQFADFRTTAGVPMTLDAAFAGFEPKTVAVPALSPGEKRDLEVVLDPIASARLELTLRGSKALGLTLVIVRFVSATPPPENENRALHDLRQVLVARSTEEDKFVLERVPHPPGNYHLVVNASLGSWLLPIQREVSLPAQGTLTVAEDAIAGGRFDVTALDSGGSRVGGDYVLRDLQGRQVLSRQFGPGGAGASDVLPAGAYDIEVRATGFKTVRRQVTVKASSLVVEEVRLEGDGPR